MAIRRTRLIVISAIFVAARFLLLGPSFATGYQRPAPRSVPLTRLSGVSGFYVGDVVEVRCVDDNQWVEAVVKNENADGSVSVVYDNGRYEFHTRVDSCRQSQVLPTPSPDARQVPASRRPESAAAATPGSLSGQLAALRKSEKALPTPSPDAGQVPASLRPESAAAAAPGSLSEQLAALRKREEALPTPSPDAGQVPASLRPESAAAAAPGSLSEQLAALRKREEGP
eukprot:TRINITY_DN11972_c0_g1_i1.p1 TRINITY_DN11972_c0_g1~~TRINITY_DN11972_c0_g1_i1.p1  ORF type:complete len:228 (-),score=42.05 TRINITY_DN11972_c0_g1_i1:365-1048(-)